jgi:hypothetical protein
MKKTNITGIVSIRITNHKIMSSKKFQKKRKFVKISFDINQKACCFFVSIVTHLINIIEVTLFFSTLQHNLFFSDVYKTALMA